MLKGIYQVSSVQPMNGSGLIYLLCLVPTCHQLFPPSRIYKIPDGKPENTFAFSGEAKNKKYATEIIHECHEAWRRLITGETPAKTTTYDLSMFVTLISFINLTLRRS